MIIKNSYFELSELHELDVIKLKLTNSVLDTFAS